MTQKILFDQIAQPVGLYNFNPALMPKAATALNKVAAGQADARIAFIGDSTTFGAWSADGATAAENAKANAVPALLAKALSSFIPTSINNQVGDYATNNPAQFATIDPTIVNTGWTQGAGATAGGFILSARINGSTLVITPTEPWDRFEVLSVFSTTDLSIFVGQLKVDGPDGQTVTIEGQRAGTGAQGLDSTVITRTTPGMGSITLTAITDPAVYDTPTAELVYTPFWIFTNTQKRAAHFINLGIRAGDLGTGNVNPLGWNRVGGGQVWIMRNAIANMVKPDLTFINLGINDMRAGGRLPTIAQFKIDYQALIDQAKITGDVVLVVPNDISATDEGAIDSSLFAAAIIELAQVNKLPWVNLREVLGLYDPALAAGFMKDGLHPTKRGYAKIAEAQSQVLTELVKSASATALENLTIPDPTSVTYTYTNDDLTTITEVIGGDNRVTTFSYTNRRLSQSVETFKGVTKTTTYSYSATGILTGEVTV